VFSHHLAVPIIGLADGELLCPAPTDQGVVMGVDGPLAES